MEETRGQERRAGHVCGAGEEAGEGDGGRERSSQEHRGPFERDRSVQDDVEGPGGGERCPDVYRRWKVGHFPIHPTW